MLPLDMKINYKFSEISKHIIKKEMPKIYDLLTICLVKLQLVSLYE